MVRPTSSCGPAAFLNRHPAFSSLHALSGDGGCWNSVFRWQKLSKGHHVSATDAELIEKLPKQVKAKEALYLRMNGQNVETFRLDQRDEMLVVLLVSKPISANELIIRWEGGRDLRLG